jgi:hypothetical protein
VGLFCGLAWKRDSPQCLAVRPEGAMKGRAKAGRARPKTKRRGGAASTRGKTPKTVRRRKSARGKQTNIAALTQELNEAHERETAATEMLRVIGSSSGSLDAVFKHMLDSAVRLCDAKFGNIYLVENGDAKLMATHNTPPAFVEFRKRTPPSTDPRTPSGRPPADQGDGSYPRPCGGGDLP